MSELLTERVNIYFHHTGFQSSFLLTSATVRIPGPVHTTPKCDTEPIRYVTFHLRDRRGAASLYHYHRNLAEITVLLCEQWPYPVRSVSSVNIAKGKSDISSKNTLKAAFCSLNPVYISNLHSWIL